MIHFRQQDFAKAAEHFQKAVELYPGFHRAYSNLGACYVKLGDRQKAYEAFSAAHQIRPEIPLYKKYMESLQQNP
jgi:Flp pilus assembly protein TadD